MSPNTRKRIISAFVLLGILLICLWFGVNALLGLCGVAGALMIDELFVNFFKKNRKDKFYILSQFIFLGIFIGMNFVSPMPNMHTVFVNGGVLLNILLLIYLFTLDMESKFVSNLAQKYSFLSLVLVIFPMMSLVSIFHYPKWRGLLMLLLIINFSMDTGAWFFGKNFGKRKLWKKVSPKKTVEGLIGGIISAGLLGGLAWKITFGDIRIINLIIFCLLGLISQLGDLVQSKLKRQFQIKDSSNLIPGHGGIYDRIDSLVFVAPFFALAIKYFYFYQG